MQLTENGQLLLDIVRDPTAALESAQQRFSERQSGGEGLLRLAMLSNTELQTAIALYRQQSPQTRLVLFERRSLDVIALVDQGDDDLGFALELPGIPRKPTLLSQKIGCREFGITLPAGHPLQKKRELRLADLVQSPLILGQPDNPMRRPVQSAFQRAGLAQRMMIAVETDDRDCVAQCVRLGIGIGIGTFEPKRQPADGVCIRSLAALLGAVPLCLVWRRSSPLTQAAATFQQTIGKLGIPWHRKMRICTE